MQNTTIRQRGPIRVLYLIDCLYGNAGGGTERQFLQFHKHSAQYGVELHVCFLRDASVHALISWQRTPIVLNLRSFASSKLLSAFRALSAYIAKHRIEIIQTLFDDSAIFGALYMSLQRHPSLPLVVGLRNIGHEHRGLRRMLIKYAYRRADHFLVNADIVATYIRDSFFVDAEHITVIRNMFQPPRRAVFCGEVDELIRNLRSAFAHISVTVANLRPVKGHYDLLRSISLLGRKDIAFLLVGTGEYESELRELSRVLGIDDQVLFLGRRDDVSELLERVDLAILPSHAEGLSNALIEYVMAGLPVVATSVGGNVEVVENRINGILVPPKDPDALAIGISTVLDQLDRFRNAAKAKSCEAHNLYSVDNTMTSYYRTYARLIALPSSS